jgi:hypothetical protein
MEVKKNKKAAYGFNAATEEYMDMIEAGIIDPTKVTRTALQNAASIAGLMITTECVIADKPEEDKKMGGMPGAAPQAIRATPVERGCPSSACRFSRQRCTARHKVKPIARTGLCLNVVGSHRCENPKRVAPSVSTSGGRRGSGSS